jgi:hypothetical protein
VASIYGFSCPGCGYQAQVAGGGDGLMAGTIHTVVCSACHSLSDALVWLAETNERQRPTCAHCRSDAVTEWRAGDACPRCGSSMAQDKESFIIAD